MISSDFLIQANLVADYNNNKSYIPISQYPTAFSTGYVKYENMPKNLIPSYFTSYYSPSIEKGVTAEEYPNLQNNIFDIFYSGLNNNISINMYGNSNIVGSAIFNRNDTIAYMKWQPNLFGEFDPRGIVRPCYIEISIKFTGIVSGNVDIAYNPIFANAFTVEDFITLRNGNSSLTFEHGNKVFSLTDFSDGVLWRDDENTTGFYFVSYTFTGWGRNTTQTGLGSYSYALPTIGCVLETPKVTYPDSITSNTKWLLTASYGSFPYGVSNRNSWGTGLRTRVNGANNALAIYYEEDGTIQIFNSSFQNASYASYVSYGYIGNYSGFNATSPIVTGVSSLIYTWTLDSIRQYHEKWTDNQRNLFIPEGRSDFGTTVPICTYDDIWNHMCLIPVWGTPSHEYEYAQLNENFWYAEIIDNEYTGNLIRGDEINENVPEWIVESNSTLNEYNPYIDRPQPDKPTDDPDSDKQVKPPLIEGDNIELQLNRTISAFTNFMTLYNITPTQLSNFGSSLWSNFNDIKNNPDFASNIYAISDTLTGTLDISQILYFITNVRLYPFSMVSIPNLTISGNNKIYLGTGKVGLEVGSNNVRILNSTVGILNCGSCYVAPLTPYNDFRDYYNTSITCYLPYCGTIELNPIEVINNTLQCYYAIDFYTGECTALLTLSDGLHSYLCGVSSGTIGVTIPLSASNSAQLASKKLMDTDNYARLIVSGLSSFVNGGLGAVSAFTNTDNKGKLDPNIVGGISSIVNGLFGVSDAVIGGFDLKAEKMGRSAVLAPSLSGGSGGSSFVLPDSVYLQIRRGTYSRPDNYARTVAYPLTKSGTLSSFSGFTICKNVDISSLNCTSDEQNEIKALLESGIYV